MARQEPFEAVIADMDGVLTRTATLHEHAWKQMFDDVLGRRGAPHPFSGADYRAHVDGKPRYDGVADFLASREIELPRGQPSDDPETETVCGLGNRKNRIFLELLEREGAEVFEDAVAALDRWRRGGLKLAVVSASRNCRRVLRAAGLHARVDVVVDGQDAAELGLGGKREIMLAAARRLEVDPSDAVILEDATAGIRAGKRAGFGLVVGIARDGHERDLREAGADQVAHSAFRVAFPRRVPNALDRRGDLAAWRGERPLAVFLDYDGTLSPIVDDPGEASMSGEMRSAVSRLAERCPVAIISGRDRPDVEKRVGIEGLSFAGNHGFDIASPGREKALPEAEEVLDEIDRAERELTKSVGELPGVIIERKRYSVAVHFRKVREQPVLDEIDRQIDRLRGETGLRRRTGKKVVELEPAVDWDKGRALSWLVEVLPDVDPERSFVVYVGDDDTDEDGFAAIEGRGAGVRVGDEVMTSLADYRLTDPDQVRAFLGVLTEMVS